MADETNHGLPRFAIRNALTKVMQITGATTNLRDSLVDAFGREHRITQLCETATQALLDLEDEVAGDLRSISDLLGGGSFESEEGDDDAPVGLHLLDSSEV